MGMVLGLCEISERTRLRILADPPLVWQVVARDAPEVYQQARERANRPGFFARLLGKSAPPTVVADLVLDGFEGIDADLDKAWNAIHFLLTGTSDEGEMPAAFLLLGGEEVGTEDLGYGPGRAVSARDVEAAAALLASLSDYELRERYDAKRMTELKIYPDIWDRGDDDAETKEYVMEYVAILRTVVADAASRGSGLLISIS